MLIEHGATSPTLERCPRLLGLDYIVALSTNFGQQAAAPAHTADVVRAELGSVCDALAENPERETKPNDAIAARAAFGLWRGTQGKPLRGTKNVEGRRNKIAEWLDISDPDKLTRSGKGGLSRLDVLGHQIAAEISLRETEFGLAQKRLDQRIRRRPEETKIGLNWISQYEEYMRIWAPVTGVEWGIKHALDANRQEKASRFDEKARDSLYFMAKYLYRLDDFEARRGCLWLFSTRESEDKINRVTWLIHGRTALTEIDKSRLRKALGASIELVDFADRCEADDHYADILKRWTAWLLTCHCTNIDAGDEPQDEDECFVHTCARACVDYADIVQREFEHIADWYIAPGTGRQVGPHISLNESYPSSHD